MTLHGLLHGFSSFSEDTRPDRMLKRQRGVDNNFKDWHQLYRRCQCEDLEGNRLIAARIPSSNISVNWSKYSEPWDVIFDHPRFGITRLLVRDLPKELPRQPPVGSPTKIHSYVAEHYPEETNYAHSEIVAHKEGRKVHGKSLSQTVKKEFRTIISDHSLLLLPPKI